MGGYTGEQVMRHDSLTDDHVVVAVKYDTDDKNYRVIVVRAGLPHAPEREVRMYSVAPTVGDIVKLRS